MRWPGRSLLVTLLPMCMWAMAARPANGQRRIETDPPIVINEILASNRAAVQDPQSVSTTIGSSFTTAVPWPWMSLECT